MPMGGSITGYLFQDFNFQNDNGQLVPAQNGPFSLPGNATGTLLDGASPIDINVDDDDDEFDDGFQDDPSGTPLNQILRDDINTTNVAGDPIQISAGAVLEVEFTLTATPQGGGAPIDLLFVAVGPGENQGDIFLVVSTADLTPNTTYDLEFSNDGGGNDYTDIVCFTPGALIETPDGHRLVETLAAGDVVTTLDHGDQRIRWVGKQTLSSGTLWRHERLRPIRVRAGALGNGLPLQDLVVSPQHRLLISSPIVQRMFGTPEVLCPAKNLLGYPGIERDPPDTSVTYVHLLLSNHEILLVNGTPAESLYPGPMAMNALKEQTSEEVAMLFAEEASPGNLSGLARTVPAGHAARTMALRHTRNGRSLLETFRDTGVGLSNVS